VSGIFRTEGANGTERGQKERRHTAMKDGFRRQAVVEVPVPYIPDTVRHCPAPEEGPFGGREGNAVGATQVDIGWEGQDGPENLSGETRERTRKLE
jgi:hypothetical protein